MILNLNISKEMNGNILEVKNIATPNESIAQPQTSYNPSDPTQFMKWVEYKKELKQAYFWALTFVTYSVNFFP